MVFVWFLLFLAWPVAEIWIFIAIGRAIGWPEAILISIATSLAGAVLMRIQGLSALNRFLQAAERSELPVATVLDAMGIFAAGALLMLPGFLTDIVGLALFIPPVRRGLTRWLFRQVLSSPASREGMRRGFRPRPGAPPKGGFRKSDTAVDAEFETLDPRPKSPQRPPQVNPTDKD